MSREQAIRIWQAAVAAADPFTLVREALLAPGPELTTLLAQPGRLIVLGGGKAGAAMARGVEAALEDRLPRLSGVINVPAGIDQTLARIVLHPGRPAGSNHPAPEGVAGVERMFALIGELKPEDAVLCLLSGGGSALLPAPVAGVSLEDKQVVTRLLHASGATIDEMNCVRKHLSSVKGGRLAQAVASRGCPLVSLIISDVIGDPLDVIASGPTAPDPSTFADAVGVLERFDLLGRVPTTVQKHLERGRAGEIPDTPRALRPGVHNLVLGNNRRSLIAARTTAEELGYRVVDLGSFLAGETQHVAGVLACIVRGITRDGTPAAPPVCLLSGGETTVALGDNPGKGGRNQEFVLALLAELGSRGMAGVVALSGGTDGEDGPTDAAGAVADAATWNQLSPAEVTAALARHDAYPLLEAAGCLLRTGLTGTNVMDVRVILVGVASEPLTTGV